MEFRSILQRAAVLAAVAAVGATGVWLTSDASAMGRNATRTYEVTVTNLTRGQVISPPFVVTHTSDMEPLWRMGEAASAGLAAIAEDADTTTLAAALDGADGVLSVTNGSGPIPPAMSGTVTIEVRGRRGLVSLVAMLVQTNDAFVGAQSLELPRSKGESRSLRMRVAAYDAGSEANNEDGAFIPGPPFGNGGARDTANAEGFVHIHSGIHGIADLAPETYDWRNPTAEIRITRVD
jgi:hypothetical protein